MELTDRPDLVPRLRPLLGTGAPPVQAVIVNVLSARTPPSTVGKMGPEGKSELPLPELLTTRNPELLAAALLALRRAPDPAYAPLVEGALNSAYIAVRDAAIQTGMVLGLRAAWGACSRLAARNAAGSRLALALLALGGELVDMNSVIKRLQVPGLRRDALWALGFAGTPAAAEAALEVIADDELGSLAGESFVTITGAPLVGSLVEIGKTDNTAPPDVDEDDDAPLPMVKPEDHLPIPNPQRLRAWWAEVRANFQPEVRYLNGRPVTAENLHSAIANGSTWRRRVWCLEVAMRSGFDLDLGAWAWKQRAGERNFPAELRIDRKLTGLAKV